MKKLTVLAVVAVFALMAGNVMALPLKDVQLNPSEEDLQDVFNSIVGDNVINAVDDQTGIGLWNTTDVSAHSTFSVAKASPWAGDFGIFSASTGEMVSLLSMSYIPEGDDDDAQLDDSDKAAVFMINNVGDLYLNGDFSTAYAGFGTFGFYYTRTDTGATFFSNQEETNVGVATYLLGDGTAYDLSPYGNGAWSGTATGNDDWLLAWEAGADRDFQDAVFLVKDISAVPEPGTLLLLGAGLLGLVGLRKRVK